MAPSSGRCFFFLSLNLLAAHKLSHRNLLAAENQSYDVSGFVF
jgi:hypothetical protein